MSDNKIVVAVVAWAAGILATVTVQQILNRRRVLSYFVQHQNIGSSTDDKTFGNVQITWNGSQVPNLYLSTVELRNESSKDLKDIKIRTWTDDTLLLTEFPILVGTTECVRYSPEFEQEISVQAGQSASDKQLDTYRRRRDYMIPVLNRDQVVRFQYLNTSTIPEQPHIWLESIHPGVIVKFRPPQTLVHGVPQPSAALSGVIAGIVFATMLIVYSPYTWITAFGCLAFGLIAQLPGAYIIRAIQKIRQWISG